ncbi:LOW QUALITY PROTEIN: arg8-vasotocin receptor-like [Pomacea canaliculata]|uniref:LOW QUALITY PROTEIN: arg8-vasotocin receptor-like n=1 Tax=Pomacea canaliculata TaxID=400727 RepID=UPI000D727BC0|nr:LOW QUALITY PROTEIN: arg8-vasotocin receptor-like [Pomacea canaliculata]
MSASSSTTALTSAGESRGSSPGLDLHRFRDHVDLNAFSSYLYHPHNYSHDRTNGSSTTTTSSGSSNDYYVGNVAPNVTAPAGTVHDIEYDFSVRVSVLYVQIVLGTIGGVLVIVWMLYNRRLRSRVNALILNLCVADLLVMYLGCLTQLVWEYTNRAWLAGDFMCRLIKFLMIFANCSSTNMLVVIAVDRHQAIRSPLREPFAVWMMTGTGWLVAALCSTPMLFVFQTRYDDTKGQMMCENFFRFKPLSHRQAFLTYASFVNFLIPLVVLMVCYTRIFLKIAQKASENQNNQLNKRQSFKPGKVHLTSTGSSSLPKAKIKTLKMTLVIVMAFILFGLPYFVAEMIMSYGDFKSLNKAVYAMLGGLAPANSAVNPYIFLLFSANMQCLRSLKLCPAQAETSRRHFMYSTASTRSDYSANYSRGPHLITTETFEMSSLK